MFWQEFWKQLFSFYSLGTVAILAIEKLETWIRQRQGWPELSKRQRIARGVTVVLLYGIWTGYRRGEFERGLPALLDVVKVLGTLGLIFAVGWVILNTPLDYGRRHDHRRYDA